ncbi:MAG: DNA-processing protein DprA [Pirellulaceae bacterium]|nr:DNA-processing protein DprA [Pirellulaceae bacterium]
MSISDINTIGESASERRAYLQLALVNGIGPRLMTSLLDFFELPSKVLSSSRTQLSEIARIGPKLADAIYRSNNDNLVDRVFAHCTENHVRILIPYDDAYPALLKEIADPPLALYIRGEFKPEDQLSIGIVGTRHATHYGRTVAEGLGRSLARAGLTIVSGLARGIDAYAHRAALEVDGRTIAFLGSSVTDVYPSEHASLAVEIASHGAVVSETHPFSKPKPGVFPQRNRLISGISLGVIIVEAAERSGALITASHAGEQGRDLFAVPGAVNSRMSRGCNRLIRDGAILVQDAQDVLEHLGPLVGSARISDDRIVRHPVELQLNIQEQAVLQAIEMTPSDMDDVIVRSGLAVSRVLSTVSALEMRGLIRRVGGRSVQRT